jgi:hypothetical protein
MSSLREKRTELSFCSAMSKLAGLEDDGQDESGESVESRAGLEAGGLGAAPTHRKKR